MHNSHSSTFHIIPRPCIIVSWIIFELLFSDLTFSADTSSTDGDIDLTEERVFQDVGELRVRHQTLAPAGWRLFCHRVDLTEIDHLKHVLSQYDLLFIFADDGEDDDEHSTDGDCHKEYKKSRHED